MISKIFWTLFYPIYWPYFKFVKKPRRERIYNKNWQVFVKENKQQIDDWMKTHGDDRKLPVFRTGDGKYHWLTRAQRRRAEKAIRTYIK